MKERTAKASANASTLALGVLFVLVLIAVSLRESITAQFSSAAHYRLYHDVASLSEVLQNSIRDGDTLKKVESLLGPGQRDESGRIRKGTAAIVARNPTSMPDGLENGDDFIGYKTGKSSWIFVQLRNGSLINFNSQDCTMDRLSPTMLGQ